MTRQEIRVELAERSYSIFVGYNAADELIEGVKRLFPKGRHAVLIFDQAVAGLADTIAHEFDSLSYLVTPISVPCGEQSKCVDQLTEIWQQMLLARTDRGSIVVALGGGVIGDLAGFAAATYARGLPLVQIPTTLLSQVDSSVGGKTGINLPGAKNMVGAFWQPSLVIIDTKSLETLPHREFVSGLAEIVKYGMILLPDLFEYLESNAANILQRNQAALEHIIVASCRAKAMVVEQDERETTGWRAILNYGHTFAHAIEATEGYGKLLHGEAVAIGMHMAATLAAQLGRIDQPLVQRQAKLLQNLQLPTRMPNAAVDKLWNAMQSDKKVEHGTLRFILPNRLGQVELVSGITADQAKAAMLACR
jgi:3-dehydroquinate synthase